MDLAQLQTELHLWRRQNFPDSDATQQFEGMAEEVGELAKARLKAKQRIRPETIGDMAEIDAIMDCVIYAMGYCSYRGWSFPTWLEEVATSVMSREWITYPLNGKTH